MKVSAPVAATLLAVAATRREVFHPWLNLRESPTNPRQSFEGIEELADSIRAQGQLQPLLVRPTPEGPEIVAGARRYRALGLVDMQGQVWCVEKEMSDVEVLEVQLVENLQRRDVTALEEADGMARLSAMGRTAEEIGGKVGKPKHYIYSRLKLATLRLPARQAFQEGKLSTSIAEALARIPTADAQQTALVKILGWGADPSVRQVREMIERHFMRRFVGAPFDVGDATLLREAGSCEACPKRTGNMPELETSGGKAGSAADMCTDPSCFSRKVDAEWESRKHAAANQHDPLYRLMPTESADQLLKLGWPGSQYVGADSRHGGDPERRTWRELLDGRLPLVIARDQKGGIAEYFDEEEAEAALEKAGFVVPSRKVKVVERSPEEIAEEKAETELRERIKKQKADLLLRAPAAASQRWPESAPLCRWLINVIDAATYEELRGEVLEAHGVVDHEESLVWHRLVNRGSDDDARALLVEMALRASSEVNSLSDALSLADAAHALFLTPPAVPAAKKPPTKKKGSADVHTAQAKKKDPKKPNSKKSIPKKGGR